MLSFQKNYRLVQDLLSLYRSNKYLSDILTLYMTKQRRNNSSLKCSWTSRSIRKTFVAQSQFPFYVAEIGDPASELSVLIGGILIAERMEHGSAGLLFLLTS